MSEILASVNDGNPWNCGAITNFEGGKEVSSAQYDKELLENPYKMFFASIQHGVFFTLKNREQLRITTLNTYNLKKDTMKKFYLIVRRKFQWELFLITLLMFACPSIYGATSYGTNLVQNGRATLGNLSGWDVSSGAEFAEGTFGFTSPDGGNVFDLYTGSTSPEWISQEIDVSSLSTDISAGTVKMELSAYMLKGDIGPTPSLICRMILEQLNGANVVIATSQVDNDVLSTVTSVGTWAQKTITINGLNASTTKLRIRLYGELIGTNGSAFVEFDGVNLKLYRWPAVINTSASSITTNSALLAGNVTTDGSPANTERGIVYSTTNTNPTIGGANVTQVPLSSGSGTFSTTLSGLSGAQIYYYNAYATNTLGTVYGTVNNFTTLTPTVTTAITNAASGIGITGATLNGAINANNHSAVVTFQYGLTTSYGTTVTADQSPVNGSAGTSVSKTISGLASSTLYHYKVVVVNTDGTTSGLDQSFTTATPVPEMDLKQSSTSIADGESYDFGSKLLSSNTDISFTIQNTGTSALTLTTPITIGGTNADQFSIQAQPTSPVAAAGSTTFTIRFSPTSPGSKSASISIGNNDSNESPYDLTITGQGYAAPIVTTGVQTINTQGVNVSSVLVPMTITTLKGSVNANNASTVVTFEYGTTTAYGTSVLATGSPVAGTSVTSVTCTPTLLPNTTYHYRVVGTNLGGTTNGLDQTFTTPVIEHFTDETTDYAQTFTEGGTTFTMTGYLFDKNDPLGGCEGSDCFYDAQMISNLYNPMPSAGIVGSIKNATNNYYVNNFWVSPGDASFKFGQYGNVIIRGKRSGTTLFTYTLTSANTNANYVVNNNYTFIDLSSYNSILIDELEFEVTDNIRYLKIDALNFNYPPAFAPTITTQAVNNIGVTTATGNGNITNLGNPNPTAYGVCWNTGGTPTTSDSKADNSAASVTGAFTASITGLNANTTYHVRAYATNTAGTSYGSEVTFTTSAIAPTVTTQAVSSITATTATGNGNITSLGVPNPTAYGVCWNTGGTPTIANSKTDKGAVSASGAFTASITSLTAYTTYYVRAFATNTAGTSYGAEVSFTTSAIAPTVTTQSFSIFTATTATANGNITALGVPNPTSYGVCWSTSNNPTTSDSKTDNGAASATGAFTAAMTNLTANTTYHVRAYAINAAGTSYGGEMVFTTEVAKTTWNGIIWTPSTPTVLDSAIINADYNSTGISCNNLTINSGFQVTFSSAVTVTHNLYVKSGATLINNGTLTVNGTSAVQQDLTGAGNSVPTGRYWYVSSPVTGSTGWAFSLLGLDILKYYNEPSHAWSAVTNSATVLSVGSGYYCRLVQNETINFGGTLNSGTITVTPTRSGSSDAKRGFNLVGNPYPSYLNWDDVEKTNIQTTMWYRSNNGLSMVFDTYNSVGAVGTDNNGTAVNKYIPPMQAFWVRVSNDGDIASLTFKNSMRSHQTGNLLKADTQNDIIRLKVSNGTNSDEAIVLFNTDATNALDAFDSEKMSNNDASIPELYTVVNSQKLVINGLESAVSSPIIPLGFKTAKSGTFTISAKSIEGLDGVLVILEDKLLNIKQDLTQTADYSFLSDSVDNASRFVLRLKSTTIANEVAELINVYAKSQSIAVATTESKGKITVNDVLGRTIATQTIVSTQTEIEVPTGVYFVTVQTNDGLVTKQVVVE